MFVFGRSDFVDIDGELLHQTELAWLVKVYGPGSEREVWIPKSVGEHDGKTSWTVPLWFVEKNELV